ncbi:MAG: GNAT family N-acetyltransferase [Nitrospirae bacterium]|nr:GNAT family N-acetyltransferase [Nitrospirota bacterium]
MLRVNSGKVILRGIAREDLDTLFEWMQDAELLRSINRTVKTSPDSHRAWYQSVLTDSSQLVLSIERNETGAFIGQCGLKHIDLKNRKAELWIFIGDRESRGKGYGGDAVRGLLWYAFEEIGLNRVSVYVISYNEDACRFYERLGFRLEGKFRQDIFMGGCFYDTVHLSVLKEEYGKSIE